MENNTDGNMLFSIFGGDGGQKSFSLRTGENKYDKTLNRILDFFEEYEIPLDIVWGVAYAKLPDIFMMESALCTNFNVIEEAIKKAIEQEAKTMYIMKAHEVYNKIMYIDYCFSKLELSADDGDNEGEEKQDDEQS